MIGKIYITSSGYDPEKGKHVNDPYLGMPPTLGACRPDAREVLKIEDHLFVISGKIDGNNQYIFCGFQVDEKIHATDAYQRFPHLRLHNLPDGQLAGNIIVDLNGSKHELDPHKSKRFERRASNYVVGRNLVLPLGKNAILRARLETMDILREVFSSNGDKPFDIVGRSARNLTEKQALTLRDWLEGISKRVEIASR